MSARFGPAGNAASYGKRPWSELAAYLDSFDLTAYEYQCGRGVRLSDETAAVFENMQDRFALSLHAPYYISLSSVDEKKRDNSIGYILDSARAAKRMGAKRIVVHSGSCTKMTREQALDLASDTLRRALVRLDEEGLSDVTVCPETMGKTGQLGTLDEVLSLCRIDERLLPCIDFGHLNARTFGGIGTSEDYARILDAVENALGSDRLRVFHAHFSRIEYTEPGGEKRHLTFADSGFGPPPEPLMELVAKRGLSPTFICESAGTQAEDAQAMQKMYQACV